MNRVIFAMQLLIKQFNLFLNNAASLAIQYGAAGIIVSNHGARQLDYVPATVMALEEVYFSTLGNSLVLI